MAEQYVTTVTEQSTTTLQQGLFPLDGRTLLRIGLTGVVIGFIVWAISRIFFLYIFHPTQCVVVLGTCQSSVGYTDTIATVIAGLVGTAQLVGMRYVRPLFPALASAIALWGLVSLLEATNGLVSLIVLILAYGVSYMLFSWIGRIHRFWLAALVAIIVIILLQIALNL